MRQGRKKRYVLLDRDGTVTVDKIFQKDPSVTELLPGAAAGLKKLAEAGWGLVLVTNQSGVGRGYLTPEDVEAVNQSVADLLARDGVALDGMYYCPHLPGAGCNCRKPRPGMVERAAKDLGFALGESVVVGDRAADVGLARAVGAKAVFVKTGTMGGMARGKCAEPDYAAADLLDAARWIIANA